METLWNESVFSLLLSKEPGCVTRMGDSKTADKKEENGLKNHSSFLSKSRVKINLIFFNREQKSFIIRMLGEKKLILAWSYLRLIVSMNVMLKCFLLNILNNLKT